MFVLFVFVLFGLFAIGADVLLRTLRAAGVSVYGGERAMKLGLTERPCESFQKEYGDLAITVEIVTDVHQAVEHCNTWGSGHTECIITEDLDRANFFLRSELTIIIYYYCYFL